ncbi:TlyA family RNA methyltransferase [Candidatus Saccharibacteria bacterium]|nr:TlyA family RNA methyltransferase [Candidatus Saccharibacteria bacterium]
MSSKYKPPTSNVQRPKKTRLDHLMVQKKLVPTRSQAESYIRMGQVTVDGKVISKPGHFVREDARLEFGVKQQYVSRAALKLASVATVLQLDFKHKVVLDVGSSTGGFTDYALQHGASKVVAVDVGTDQLHPRLRGDVRVELHEKTDIRKFVSEEKADVAIIDVSFISMRMVLASVSKLVKPKGQIIAMLKPQFEAGKDQLNKGIVKNSAQRRDILQDFEAWCRQNKYVILKKSDSAVAGEKGNVERFYLLTKAL